MSTSNRTIAIESIVAGALAAAAAALWAPSDPWLGGQALHPAWIAVLALATRYGRAGLIVSAPIVWSIIGLTALVAGAGVAGASRLLGAADLSAAMAASLVAAIASLHHSRQTDLRRQRDELDLRARAEADAALAMREALELLRDRHDRIDLSVTFWRDIAARVQGQDVSEAARAALQLAMVRTGARAGIVRRIDDGATTTVAWRGAWSLAEPIPRDIFPDRTITAAIERGRVVTALEVEDAGGADSDVAVPIRSEQEVVGVIALRGAPGSRLVAAALRDLDVVASWVGPSLTRVEDPHPWEPAIPSPHDDEPAMAMAAGMGAGRLASGSGPVRALRPRPAAQVIRLPLPEQAPSSKQPVTTDRVHAPSAPIPAVAAPPPPSRTLARRKGGAPRGLRRTYGPSDYARGARGQ
jgi:hypothetical protein